MTDNEYSKTREAAAEALIHWAKTGWQQFTMRDAVNNYLEASGANRGSVVILGGLSLVNSLHAYTFASLKRKKLISTTPLNDALNALILALNASAAAFVLLFTKKFRILS